MLSAPLPDLSVEVTVAYVPEHSYPQRNQYRFAYTIRIINRGPGAAQVIARHWDIENANGLQEQVRGLGVVGQQPMLEAGESFEYTSSCLLATPSGSMQGHYLCVTVAGETFLCDIPRFGLDAHAASAAVEAETPGGEGDATPRRTLH